MYELIIIGSGPAGLTAAIYANRARINTLILEKISFGGQLLLTEAIENFSGFPDGVSSFELIERMLKQARKFGAQFKTAEVASIAQISGSHKEFKIITQDGQTLAAKAVIVATGAQPKKIGIKGEQEFQGKGVSYCATCDGPFYKDRNVCVVGGGNSAIEEALFLTRFAKKVFVIHRRDKLRAAKILEEEAKANKKIEFIWDSVPEEIIGSQKVGALTVKNIKTGQIQKINCEGIFIFVGLEPNTGFLKGICNLTPEGYVITDEDMATSCPGIFACGDCRKKSLYQVITAASDGAIAVNSCYRYLENVSHT